MWQVLALMFSLIVAAVIHLNHVYKIDGIVLVILRAIPMVLIGVITLFFLDIPQGYWFYIISVFMGMLWMLADMILFNMAARHGGRVASLFQPIKIFFVFILWIILKPETLEALLNPVWKLYGVIFCFFLIAGAMLTIRKSDAKWDTLLLVSAVAVLLGVDDTIAKIILEDESVLGGAMAFSVVSAASASVSACFVYKYIYKNQLTRIFTKHHMKGSFLSGTLLTFGFFAFYIALSLSPNPAYVLAIVVLSVLWLTVYYRIKHHEKSNLWSGLVMMIGAIGLMLITG